MHPDVNKSPDAHEQFVLLNEAYEYLMNVGSSSSASSENNSASYQWTQEDWQAQQRENAKERARAYARMRYEEFIKSDYYKEQKVFDTVTAHLGILVSLLLLTVFPAVMVSTIGIEALLGVAGINIILVGLHIKSYQNLNKISSTELKSSLRKLVSISSFQALILIIINIPILIKVVGNTLVTFSFVFSAYAISILIFLILTRSSKKRNILTFGVAPTLVSLLFLINYTFSSYPTQQKFSLHWRNSIDESSMITLDGGQFDEYPGIRTFFDYNEVRYANEIIYTFEYGLLGQMVMKEYQFLRD